MMMINKNKITLQHRQAVDDPLPPFPSWRTTQLNAPVKHPPHSLLAWDHPQPEKRRIKRKHTEESAEHMHTYHDHVEPPTHRKKKPLQHLLPTHKYRARYIPPYRGIVYISYTPRKHTTASSAAKNVLLSQNHVTLTNARTDCLPHPRRRQDTFSYFT